MGWDERGSPCGSGQKLFPGEAKAIWESQSLGAMSRVFLEPAPSVGPPWANKAMAAGTRHGGCREGVASTLEQAETHQVCEVLEGILQVLRLVLCLPAELSDLVTSSGLVCPHQRITLCVLGHPPACPTSL